MEKTTKPIVHVAPVKGAAEYYAGVDGNGNYYVAMQDTDGLTTQIDNAKTLAQAKAKAVKWQKKENAAVLKASK